jgi:putative redox protein
MEIKVLFPGNMKVNAKFGNFEVFTDQKKKVGGDETAPEPFSLFLVSIGTCTGAYILSFCKERNIDTEGLGLKLTTEADKEKKRVSKIKIDIQLPSGFPEKYKDAIVKTAELCAVKKHILMPPQFETIAHIKS